MWYRKVKKVRKKKKRKKAVRLFGGRFLQILYDNFVLKNKKNVGVSANTTKAAWFNAYTTEIGVCGESTTTRIDWAGRGLLMQFARAFRAGRVICIM